MWHCYSSPVFFTHAPALSQSAPPRRRHSDAGSNQNWRQSRSERRSRAWAVAGWESRRTSRLIRAAHECALLSDRFDHPPIIDCEPATDWSTDPSCPCWRSTSERPSAWRCPRRMRRSWRKARSQTQHPRGSWVTMRRMKGRAERAGAPRTGRSDTNHHHRLLLLLANNCAENISIDINMHNHSAGLTWHAFSAWCQNTA